MSKYRTPLLVDMGSIKISKNMDKYRLPFKKDEPVEQKQFTLSKNKDQSLIVTSHSKLPKEQTVIQLKNIQMLQEEEQKETVNDQTSENNENKQEAIIGQFYQVPFIQESKLIKVEEPSSTTNQKQELHQYVPAYRSQQKKAIQKSQTSQRGKKHRRIHSTASRYADDQNSNNEVTSHSQYQSLNNQRNKKKIFERLPIIGEKDKNRTEEDLGEQSNIKVWEELAKEIEQRKAFKLRKNSEKGKSKNKRKLKYSLSKRKDQKQQQLKTEYKKFNQEQSNKLITNIGMYDNLDQIKEEISNRQSLHRFESIKKQSPNLFIQNLKAAIDLKVDRSKKGKIKIPLELYISSYEQIRQINPFFRKITQLGGCILLSLGKLQLIQPGKTIYSEGDPLKYMYIIVYGKILLTNKHKTLKKYSLTGQTLGEQELFQQQKSYIERLHEGYRLKQHSQDAKAISKCCLLALTGRKYYKMYKQLHKMGYKQLFTLIDNLFRINYIGKQASQHQQSRQKINTLSMKDKSNHKNFNFFH